MALEINALVSFANSLRSLAQQIDKLAKENLNSSGSQNLASSFSAALDSARDELAVSQSAQPGSSTSDNASISSARVSVGQLANTSGALTECPCCKAKDQTQDTTDKGPQLPPWLTAAQPNYEANRAYWSASQEAQRALWEDNPEALRKLQETYSPDLRQQAVAWLEENISPNWQANAPHVMETGKLLNSPLPDYLQEHYDRYQAMQEAASAASQKARALWEDNPEALRKLQETYHPDVTVRQEAVAWLEKTISPNWRASAPHVMETANMLAALGEPSSSLKA